MIPTVRCRAKNPSICAFHGTPLTKLSRSSYRKPLNQLDDTHPTKIRFLEKVRTHQGLLDDEHLEALKLMIDPLPNGNGEKLNSLLATGFPLSPNLKKIDATLQEGFSRLNPGEYERLFRFMSFDEKNFANWRKNTGLDDGFYYPKNYQHTSIDATVAIDLFAKQSPRPVKVMLEIASPNGFYAGAKAHMTNLEARSGGNIASNQKVKIQERQVLLDRTHHYKVLATETNTQYYSTPNKLSSEDIEGFGWLTDNTTGKTDISIKYLLEDLGPK